MGFFSWECAVSGESVANIYAGQPVEQSKCYLITPDKTYYEPSYEGYGVFGDKDVYGLLGESKLGNNVTALNEDVKRDEGISDYFNGSAAFSVKVVLARYYTGQSYDELPASGDCKSQGFFY